MDITYGDCIHALVPNASFNIDNDDYSSLVWEDNNYTQPTEEEILVKKSELESQFPMKILREQRDFLLLETDKYSLPDFPHSSETIRQAWLTYRQNLRDITTTQTPQMDMNFNLINVTWPTDPNGNTGF